MKTEDIKLSVLVAIRNKAYKSGASESDIMNNSVLFVPTSLLGRLKEEELIEICEDHAYRMFGRLQIIAFPTITDIYLGERVTMRAF